MTASITKDEKIRQIELIREKKRRMLAAKPVYKPNRGQLAVHTDDKKIRMVASGNGSGKTALAVNEAVWWATGYNPITKTFTKVPATIIILLDSPSKVDELWLPELRKWYDADTNCSYHKNGKPYITEIRFKNGSCIRFYFHQQEAMIFEGIMLDYLIADEPFPRAAWTGLTRGARKKHTNPKFLLIGTPLGQPWMHKELWLPAEEGKRDDIGIHRFSTEVNESNLAEGYIESYKKNLTEKEIRVRLHGEFAHLGGLALAHLFKEDVHIIDPFPWPSGWPCVVVVDPHPRKAHIATLVGAGKDGQLYYIKEMASSAAPKAFAKELKEFYRGYRVLDVVVDSLGETPGTGGDGNMSFSDVLRACGVPARSTSYREKQDEAFIQKIRQVLEIPDEEDNMGKQTPTLLVFEGNPGIVTDIRNVQWLKYKGLDEFKPKLDISNKDYLACLKYALSTPIILMGKTGRRPQVKRTPRRSPWSGRK